MFGSYTFTNRFTGYSYSDFLLGLPQSTSITYVRPPQAARLWFLSGFIQDDWKISPRLTLSYGLRYEYDAPPVDQTDTIANFDRASGSLVVPNETVRSEDVNPLFPKSIAILTANAAGLPERTLRFGDKNNFQPRLGFAFRPFSGNRTVLRGGYGVYSDDIGGDLFGQLYGGPFRVTQSFTNNIVNGAPLLTFTNPFLGPGSLGSIDLAGIDPHLKNPFIQQWNVTAEQALTDTMALRVSYIGSSATQIVYGRNINQPVPSSIPFSQDRRPYPIFRNIIWRENGGNQNYQALSTEVHRRFSAGLEFQAAWTWAKTITDTDEVGITEGGPTLENAYDRLRERADAQYSPRHRFVSNAIWQLPFGKGRQMLNSGGITDWIFGGWQLTGTFNAQTGEYFTPAFSGSDPSNTQTLGGIPDRIGNGNLPSDQRTIDRWFDASAFVAPPNGRFGNSGKNILIGPGRQAVNLGAFKSFRITERVALRLQATFTNAFNHPNFGAPNANISGACFGRNRPFRSNAR